jgi:hypothetical protein
VVLPSGQPALATKLLHAGDHLSICSWHAAPHLAAHLRQVLRDLLDKTGTSHTHLHSQVMCTTSRQLMLSWWPWPAAQLLRNMTRPSWCAFCGRLNAYRLDKATTAGSRRKLRSFMYKLQCAAVQHLCSMQSFTAHPKTSMVSLIKRGLLPGHQFRIGCKAATELCRRHYCCLPQCKRVHWGASLAL